MAGNSAREISDELIGSGTMSSEMPNDSTRSRKRDNASTDHASSTFADGRPLQMLFTPNAAQARRIASEWPCCVPTFILTFGDVVGATMPDFAGACACCADTTASASAATGMPAPASLTNSRRFMTPPAILYQYNLSPSCICRGEFAWLVIRPKLLLLKSVFGR